MKKEEMFNIIGEVDEQKVATAGLAVKKIRKPIWIQWGTIAACLAVVAVLGVGMIQGDFTTIPNNTNTEDNHFSTMKPVINFEGVVTNVEGNKITMNNGQIVIITEDTVFGGDTNTSNPVSEDILIGNFIQGYTKDNVDGKEITANKIWCNEGRTSGSAKRIINFEGRVIKVEQNNIILDTGKIIKIDENTTITSSDGNSADIIEGDYIQGYSENIENSEIEAEYILVTIL